MNFAVRLHVSPELLADACALADHLDGVTHDNKGRWLVNPVVTHWLVSPTYQTNTGPWVAFCVVGTADGAVEEK